MRAEQAVPSCLMTISGAVCVCGGGILGGEPSAVWLEGREQKQEQGSFRVSFPSSQSQETLMELGFL